jgi:hypothetical protein
MKSEIARSQMTAEERRLRNRAAQLLDGAGLLHGSLVVRYRRCGKPNCHCAKAEGHRGLVLTVRLEGRTEQLHIPRHLESTVQRWVEQDHRLRDLLAELARLHTDKIRELKRQGAASSEDS